MYREKQRKASLKIKGQHCNTVVYIEAIGERPKRRLKEGFTDSLPNRDFATARPPHSTVNVTLRSSRRRRL